MRRFFESPDGQYVGLGETVRSHDDLVDFVAALRANRTEEPQKWESSTLGAYLDAIARVAAYEVPDSAEGEFTARWADIAEWLWDGRNYE
ncbi:hypothetical protein GCM10020358_77550 [Amorphoplanes nipponensis]|uniref:DUF7660 domain-containing protein n=1 Tax=Actinoplanes nipponensis TaxID=135950 RepID=A0A919JIB7_9ACTN|nr:hypothetical protein [Actinoplanes nipponensis]GIE49885.1 hypothetical protein Ani05nite_34190 [Actinoplanes nipponensis]